MSCVRPCAVLWEVFPGEKNQPEASWPEKAQAWWVRAAVWCPSTSTGCMTSGPSETLLSGPGLYCDPRALYLVTKVLSALQVLPLELPDLGEMCSRPSLPPTEVCFSAGVNWKALRYALESRKNSKFLIPRALKGGKFLRKNKFKQGSRGGARTQPQLLICPEAQLWALEPSWSNL